jgi:hypothetical protein
MSPQITAALVTGVISFALLYKPFFGKEKDFWECVGYSLLPDFISWMDKNLQRDYGKSLKLGCFLAICIGAGYVAHTISNKLVVPSKTVEPESEDTY